MAHYILDARTATPHFPGIGRYVGSLASAISQLKTPGERLTLFGKEPNPLLGQVPAARSRGRAAVASPFHISQQWRVPRRLRALRAGGPTLYHSPYYAMPYRTGLPTVLTFYDVTPLKYPRAVSLKARLLFRPAAAMALRAADHVIAVSEAARCDLLRFFSLRPDKVSVTRLAAGQRFRPQTGGAVQRVRGAYCLPDSFILYVGINKPHKNLPALIDAYAQLPPRQTPPLVIAGAWDRRYPQARLRAKQRGLDRSVRFLGPIRDADLPALYGAATVFVFPSLYEGFGLPVLEAMACGAPVACANVASLPEIVGDEASLFDPRSVNAMTGALAELLEDDALRARRSRSGLAQARRFSWVATAAATLRCYRELLA